MTHTHLGIIPTVGTISGIELPADCFLGRRLLGHYKAIVSFRGVLMRRDSLVRLFEVPYKGALIDSMFL